MTGLTPGQHSLPTLYTIAEVADALKVSTKTVRRWIDAGELAVHRIGRAIRISGEDLQDFLNQRRDQNI